MTNKKKSTKKSTLLITYEQLRLLEHAVELLDRDLDSTHCRLISVNGTSEQYNLVMRRRAELAAALSVLRTAVWAQLPGDPEKTGWVLKPVEK
jgi:hypothetical protein